VVDGGEGGDVTDEFVQEGRLYQVCLLWDERFLRQHYLLRRRRVRRQQPPVDVASVTQVRVVTVLENIGSALTSSYVVQSVRPFNALYTLSNILHFVPNTLHFTIDNLQVVVVTLVLRWLW